MPARAKFIVEVLAIGLPIKVPSHDDPQKEVPVGRPAVQGDVNGPCAIRIVVLREVYGVPLELSGQR
jgi:hypothetical protein